MFNLIEVLNIDYYGCFTELSKEGIGDKIRIGEDIVTYMPARSVSHIFNKRESRGMTILLFGGAYGDGPSRLATCFLSSSVPSVLIREGIDDRQLLMVSFLRAFFAGREIVSSRRDYTDFNY